MLYPEYVMRLYYNKEKAQKDEEGFKELCDLFCNEPNFDLCDVTNIGNIFSLFQNSSLIKSVSHLSVKLLKLVTFRFSNEDSLSN